MDPGGARILSCDAAEAVELIRRLGESFLSLHPHNKAHPLPLLWNLELLRSASEEGECRYTSILLTPVSIY